ncbi:MAG: DUF2089 domain-containing protein [Bacillota bacterium]|jgi:hypothetical protein
MRNQMLGRCPVCNSGLDVTKLHCPHCNTGIEGKFAMCKFCQLPADQKAFAEVFIKCRGNIKEVEKELGISYPTVRSRLETLIESLGYRAQPVPKEDPETKERRKAILEDLNEGKITSEDAIALLRKL